MGGSGNYTLAYDSGNDTAKKFNFAIFYGTVNGTETVVKCAWTGSVAGIVELSGAEAFTNTFPADSTLSSLTAGTTAQLPTGYATDATDYPTVAMADCPATEGGYVLASAGGTGKAGAYTAFKNATFVDAGDLVRAAPKPAVALVTFEWVLGPSDDGSVPITNMTQQQAAALINNGYLSLMAFTGNPADKYNFVFLVGRNEDSGTRLEALAEGQTGFNPTVKQLEVNGVLPSGTITTSNLTGLALMPASVSLYKESTITWNTKGHSGYWGGGDVAKMVACTTPNANVGTNGGLGGLTPGLVSPIPDGFDNGGTGTSKVYLVGYLGNADVTSALHVLPYNGVSYSAANVQNGTYTFWNYEHCYYLNSGTNIISSGDSSLYNAANGNGCAYVADQIADILFTSQALFNPGSGASGVLNNSSVLVNRSQAGAPVTQNF